MALRLFIAANTRFLLLTMKKEPVRRRNVDIICDKTTNHSYSSGSHVTFRYLTMNAL